MKILKFLSASVVLTLILIFQNSSIAGASFAEGFGDVYVNPMPTVHACPFQRVSLSVVGEQDTISVCSKATEGLRLGVYFSGSSYHSVISFPGDKNTYSLTLKCDGYTSCFYSQKFDLLIRKVNIPGTIVHKLEIFKNVNTRLSRVFSVMDLTAHYKFDTSNPDYTLQTDNGPLAVGGIGISDNGRWLGVEFREKGLGVFDLENFTLKRISNNFYYYNTGYRPKTEIAISNNGEYIISTGVNAGFYLYHNDGVCGDYPSTQQIVNRAKLDSSCKNVANIGLKIPNFKMSEQPRFSPRGDFFTIIAHNTQNKRFNVLAHAKSDSLSSQIEYLALGDSFTSGEGEIGDEWYLIGTNDGIDNCHLSGRSYPFLIHSFGDARSVACSGAKTVDIIGGNTYAGQGDRLVGRSDGLILEREAIEYFVPGRVPQIDFVARYQPEVVTIGIGGNDVGFMGKLSACLAPGTCHWAIEPEAKTQTALEIQTLFYKLIDVYAEIKKLSPNTKIYAIGYPKIIDTRWLCQGFLGNLITQAEAMFIDKGIEYLNKVVKSAAMQAGVHYIDIEDVYGDHKLCGLSSSRAIESFRLGDDIGVGRLKVIGNESFHPTPLGHQLVADRIESTIGGEWHEHCISRVPATCGFNTDPPVLPEYWGMILAVDGRYYHRDMVPDRVKKLEKTPVALRNYSVMPNTAVRMNIYSDKTFLGEMNSNTDGSVSGDIILPENLLDGFHTLELEGRSYSDEPVVYYKTIYIQPQPEPDSVLGSTEGTSAVESTEWGDESIDQPQDAELQLNTETVSAPTDSKTPAVLDEKTSTAAVTTNAALEYVDQHKEPDYKINPRAYIQDSPDESYEHNVNRVLGITNESSSSAVPADKITKNGLADHIYLVVGAGLIILFSYFLFTNNKT